VPIAFMALCGLSAKPPHDHPEGIMMPHTKFGLGPLKIATSIRRRQGNE